MFFVPRVPQFRALQKVIAPQQFFEFKSAEHPRNTSKMFRTYSGNRSSGFTGVSHAGSIISATHSVRTPFMRLLLV